MMGCVMNADTAVMHNIDIAGISDACLYIAVDECQCELYVVL